MKVEFKIGKDDEFGVVQKIGYTFITDEGDEVFATFEDVELMKEYIASYDAGNTGVEPQVCLDT